MRELQKQVKQRRTEMDAMLESAAEKEKENAQLWEQVRQVCDGEVGSWTVA